jgi:hypothetical protein
MNIDKFLENMESGSLNEDAREATIILEPLDKDGNYKKSVLIQQVNDFKDDMRKFGVEAEFEEDYGEDDDGMNNFGEYEFSFSGSTAALNKAADDYNFDYDDF